MLPSNAGQASLIKLMLMPTDFCSKSIAALLVSCGMCSGQSGWCTNLKLAHITHGGRTPMSNVEKGKGYKYPLLVVCWPSVQCGLVWCGRPVCQCARWRPVCAVSGLGLAQPAAWTPSHHLHQRRQHDHQIITSTSRHMCRKRESHS